MSAGHIAMTFAESFLLALLLLVIGSGFLKGNISAQVGALYPQNDEEHEDGGDAEAVVPAKNLCEQTAEQRSNDRANVDSGGEDDETARAPRFVILWIKGADLRRNISLQETGADDEQQQGEQE